MGAGPPELAAAGIHLAVVEVIGAVGVAGGFQLAAQVPVDALKVLELDEAEAPMIGGEAAAAIGQGLEPFRDCGAVQEVMKGRKFGAASLARYAKPGIEAVAVLTAEHDRGRRHRR